MSELFKLPSKFVKHDRFEVDHRTVTINALYEVQSNCKRPVALRDDHVILAVIDGLVYLYTSFKRWRSRRRTLRALADLDERQLRDIGLTRNDPLFDVHFRSPAYHDDYRAFPELDDRPLAQHRSMRKPALAREHTH